MGFKKLESLNVSNNEFNLSITKTRNKAQNKLVPGVISHKSSTDAVLIRNAVVRMLKGDMRLVSEASNRPSYGSDSENVVKHEQYNHHNSMKLQIRV